jgi:hypothetical protein
VQYSRNIATCDVSQPCPLPEIVITGTVSLDGICPGLPALEVPHNLQEVTFCFEIKNASNDVTLRDHSLRAPALGGEIFSGTLSLGPGEFYLFQKDWSFDGQEGECYAVPSTWEAMTPEGFGQPQGEDADVPFITTTYSAQDVGNAQVCIGAPLMVDLDNNTFAADEGAGSTPVTVTLSTTWVTTVTVDYATSDGTATAGEDYILVSGTLTFAPGVTEHTFEVPLLDDLLAEGDETVVLTLANATYADIGGNSPAILTIQDDDVPPVYRIFLPLVAKSEAP